MFPFTGFWFIVCQELGWSPAAFVLGLSLNYTLAFWYVDNVVLPTDETTRRNVERGVLPKFLVYFIVGEVLLLGALLSLVNWPLERLFG